MGRGGRGGGHSNGAPRLPGCPLNQVLRARAVRSQVYHHRASRLPTPPTAPRIRQCPPSLPVCPYIMCCRSHVPRSTSVGVGVHTRGGKVVLCVALSSDCSTPALYRWQHAAWPTLHSSTLYVMLFGVLHSVGCILPRDYLSQRLSAHILGGVMASTLADALTMLYFHSSSDAGINL